MQQLQPGPSNFRQGAGVAAESNFIMNVYYDIQRVCICMYTYVYIDIHMLCITQYVCYKPMTVYSSVIHYDTFYVYIHHIHDSYKYQHIYVHVYICK